MCICNPGSWSCGINVKILVSATMFIFLVVREKEPLHVHYDIELKNLNANSIYF